jgi:hypothetical protein
MYITCTLHRITVEQPFARIKLRFTRGGIKLQRFVRNGRRPRVPARNLARSMRNARCLEINK